MANIVPSVLFYVCLIVGDIWVALGAALAWCYGAAAWRASTQRPRSMLLWITVIVLTAKTALTFATGDTFLYFAQPALTDVLIALLFLVSLATARPVVARLAADFYPMDQEVAGRPRVQRLFWRLTLLWAVLCLARAMGTIWLLEETPLATFVAAKTALATAVVVFGAAATVVLAFRVARHEGLIHKRVPAF